MVFKIVSFIFPSPKWNGKRQDIFIGCFKIVRNHIHTSTDQKQVFHPCTLIYRCNRNANSRRSEVPTDLCVCALCPPKKHLFHSLLSNSRSRLSVFKTHLTCYNTSNPSQKSKKYVGVVSSNPTDVGENWALYFTGGKKSPHKCLVGLVYPTG